MVKGFNHTDNEKKYADIFHASRPIPKNYPQVSMEERASQFGSFEALVGFDDELDETARFTEEPGNLSEDQKSEIDERLRLLNAYAVASPPVRVTYFVHDRKKTGGIYITATGRFKSFDESEGCIIINNDSKIPVDTIANVESPMFE